MSYRIDHAAVRRIAREEFGVREPIELRRRRRRWDERAGLYTVRAGLNGWTVWRTDRVHEILLVSQLSARQMLQTLAHELRHCWQSELYPTPDDFSAAYELCRDGFEDDAEMAAHRLWPRLQPVILTPQSRGTP